jgi:hypothetical protein
VQDQKKRYAATNADILRAKKFRYYRTHRQETAARGRLYRRANSEKIKELQARYRIVNREKVNDSIRRHQKVLHDETLSSATRHFHEWTIADMTFALRQRTTMTHRQIALNLGRTHWAVSTMLQRLDGGWRKKTSLLDQRIQLSDTRIR